MRFKTWLAGAVAAGVLVASSTLVFSQEKKPDAKPAGKQDAAAGQPTPEQMEKAMKNMQEAGTPGENHKLLADYMVGEWTYENKMYHGPEPEVSKGTCTTKAFYDGRYVHAVHKGTINMPGADGKPTEVPFEGTAMNGYDNVKKKFVGTWVDNFSTCIVVVEGTYDAKAKTITYTGEMPDCMNDNKPCKFREVVRLVSKDKHVLEWYQEMGGKESKTMEITYTRKN